MHIKLYEALYERSKFDVLNAEVVGSEMINTVVYLHFPCYNLSVTL